MRNIILQICAVCLFMMALPVLSQAEDIKIAFLLGKVEYKKAGEENWNTAKKDMLLTEKDMLRTGNSSTVLIQVENTLKMKLSANTTLKLDSLFPKVNVNLNGGKVWVDLTKLSKSQSFNIRTPTSLIGVRGTEFIYENGENEDKAYVMDGVIVFGSDLDTAKELTKGKLGILKGKQLNIREITKEEDQEFKKGFPLVISSENLKQLRLRDRFLFRNEIRRELRGIDLVRNVSRLKYKEDITTGKTVNTGNEVVRIQQYLRKVGDNTIQIINVSSKPNFINVVEYIGTFSNNIPNTLAELINITSSDNSEIKKQITMAQRDLSNSSNNGQLKLVDDKTSGTHQISIAANNNLAIPLPALVDVTSNYSKLKQIGNNTYLSANYGSIILKVTPLDKDGKPLMIASTDGVDLNTLASMSFKIEFSGGTLGSAVLTAYALPDVGLILINN